MATSKRRFVASSSPVPPPQPDNPFRKVFAAAGVLLMLVLSIPMFTDAVYSQSVPQSPLGDQTNALIGALTTLGSQIGLLKNDIQQLRTQMVSGGSGAAAGTIVDTSMADCLQSCRSKLASCLSRQKPTSNSTGSPLDTCRTQANNCMNTCKPKPVDTVACEDRCAVALGGCVVQAGSDPARLDDCRVQNRKCVIAACRPRTDASATSRVPTEICRDQCNRDLEICQKAASFDREELAGCNAVATKCLNDVCTDAYEVPSTATRSPFIPTKPETESGSTFSCDVDCETSLKECLNIAGSNTNAQAECQSKGKLCKEVCVKPTTGASPTQKSVCEEACNQNAQVCIKTEKDTMNCEVERNTCKLTCSIAPVDPNQGGSE